MSVCVRPESVSSKKNPRTLSMSRLVQGGGIAAAWLLGGCNSVLGIDQFSINNTVDDHSSGTGGSSGEGGVPDGGTSHPDCTTNRECTDRLTASNPDGGTATVPAVCVQATGHCAALLSQDCTTITGDYTDDRAIVLGSLFATVGSQAATNLQRQQSATLAIEEINKAGGVQNGQTSAGGRPLVMVSCDAATNLVRAGQHLVNDLHVPAIVGPNTSQDTLDVSTKVTIQGGTLVISPTAVASSIASLLDKGLTWLMVPTDVQRSDLMIAQINDIEKQLQQDRQKTTLRLGVIFRNDALGTGTRSSLDALGFNGKPLADPSNLGNNVKIDPYDAKAADQKSIVDSYVKFAPDIVVLAGTAEAITKVLVPLEAAWTGGTTGKASERPYYMLIDSVKVPELITAVTGNDDLRHRIRGTGVTPGVESAPVFNAFKVDYQVRYPGSTATTSGMGPAYDATYAIAYALAASKDLPVSGDSIAKGLRKLSGGSTTLTIESTKILAAFQHLVAGDSIRAVGTFGPLDWDENGTVRGGTLEMWCIGAPNGTPAYAGSTLKYDLSTKRLDGTYTQCAP